jgi:hypothetical protein
LQLGHRPDHFLAGIFEACLQFRELSVALHHPHLETADAPFGLGIANRNGLDRGVS